MSLKILVEKFCRLSLYVQLALVCSVTLLGLVIMSLVMSLIIIAIMYPNTTSTITSLISTLGLLASSVAGRIPKSVS
jgi:hypothetical protein